MIGLKGGWAKGFDFDKGGGRVSRGGQRNPPIFAIRKTMTIAYIKVLVTS